MQEAWSILRPLFLQIVIPGVAASAATLLFLSLLSRWLNVSAKWQFWQAPLAVAAGLVAGNFSRQDVPYWSLEHDFYSLIPAALALLLFSTIAQWHAEAKRPWLALLAHTSGALLTAWWLTPAEVVGSRWLWIGLVYVAIRSNEFVLSRSWNDSLGRAGPSLLAVLWGGAGAAMLLAFVHAMRYFDLVAIFSSALLGVGVVMPFTKLSARAAYSALALFFPAMMLIAQLGSYTEVPLASFLLMGVAPCALLFLLPELAELLEKRSPRFRAAMMIVMLLIPLGAAIAMAAISESQAQASQEQASQAPSSQEPASSP